MSLILRTSGACSRRQVPIIASSLSLPVVSSTGVMASVGSGPVGSAFVVAVRGRGVAGGGGSWLGAASGTTSSGGGRCRWLLSRDRGGSEPVRDLVIERERWLPESLGGIGIWDTVRRTLFVVSCSSWSDMVLLGRETSVAQKVAWRGNDKQTHTGAQAVQASFAVVGRADDQSGRTVWREAGVRSGAATGGRGRQHGDGRGSSGAARKAVVRRRQRWHA